MRKYFSIVANECDTYLDYALFTLVAIYTLQASPSEIGVLGACYALPFFALSRIVGRYVDYCEVNTFRTLMFLVCILATPFIASVDSIYFLYTLLLIKVSCRVGLTVSMVKLNQDESETKVFYEITGYITNLARISVPIIAVAANEYYGIWSIIIFSTAFSILGFFSSFFNIKESIKSRLKIDNTHMNNVFVDAKSIIKNNQTLNLLVYSYIFASISLYFSNDMLSLFFKELTDEPISIGFIISSLGLGGIIGTKLSSYFLNKLSIIQCYIFSLLVNVVAFFTMGIVNHGFISVIGCYLIVSLTGVSSGMSFVIMKSGLRTLVDFDRLGSVTGYIQKIASIVAISLPVIGGVVADQIGIQMTFIVTSLMMFLVCIHTFIKLKAKSISLHKGNLNA
ncbi:MFS transporter [Vibrio cholerae]|uniref:MFS transporter n=1 Tax=Vibrio cholerae TaxID=666 RepID=UPI0021D18671|nr:MFS transporter [Vibrio cholerae]MCU4218304.1 MFS transporter [Vibrio cholerae]HCZ9559230.1 MFS transporter [Vibrio cholerae]HCZ9562757.1 MFS transporter [Vibrio cholerae]HCZ9572900.1 MFS transporter [Vibrio cholerae]HCZ9574053.1 MFS transporter [Vibrio cholerae]